jgi:hypothetical protein
MCCNPMAELDVKAMSSAYRSPTIIRWLSFKQAEQKRSTLHFILGQRSLRASKSVPKLLYICTDGILILIVAQSACEAEAGDTRLTVD